MDNNRVTIGQYVELAGDRRLSNVEYRALGPLVGEGAFTRDDLQAFVSGQIDFVGLRRRAWASEESPSTRTYPPEYRGVRGLDEQAAILRAALPEIGDYDHAFAGTLGQVADTEGPFLVARSDKVAASYGAAVEWMFRLLAAARPFTNYRENQLGERYLHQHEHTVAMLERACRVQQGDLLVLSSQFGELHAGRSPRRSRALLAPNEWGGGAFATACMMLTHPERLGTGNELWLDCAGDEYAPRADGRFSDAPYFRWSDGRVRFSTSDVSHFHGYYGSVSARLPE